MRNPFKVLFLFQQESLPGRLPLTLTGVTIVDSVFDGLYTSASAGWVSLSHTIIADSGGANCVAYHDPVTSLGHNLDSADTCSFDVGLGDLVDTDPLLGPLRDNGGPTLTRAPLAGSAVIDAGATDCGLAVDQRGTPRPVDGNGNGVPLCDIGAVEWDLIFADGFESGSAATWSLVVP